MKNLYKRLKLLGLYSYGLIMEMMVNIWLISDKRYPTHERTSAWTKLAMIATPFTYFLDSMGLWFSNNSLFVSFVCGNIMLCFITGGIAHKKLGDFKWKTLWIKTMYMCLGLIAVYAVLEMILIIAQDNIITELFRISIQVATLVYPGSKILKSSHVITDGGFPPKWVMKRFYVYDETGDLTQFLKQPEKE